MARTVPFRRTLTEELRDPEFAREYTTELQRLRLAEQVAKARQAAGLTQGQLAQRMRTSQPAVARMERHDYGGYTIKGLTKFARATGHELRVDLRPARERALHAFAKKSTKRTAKKKR
jgi:ribosome-binding protein aMBF1 (putative translation factor)